MKYIHRAWIYLIGMLVLALGLTLNTKTGLGVSPILSVAYSSAQIWGFNFGDTTFVLYSFFVLGELLIRGKKRQWYDLLQLPLSLVFSRVLNVFDAVISYNPELHTLPENLAMLVLAILTTGIGVSMTVNMRLIPNPGDGIVQALADRMGRDQGFAKNIFDIGCVSATAVLCLVAKGEIVGIGIGTLGAMIGVGRSIALANHFFRVRMCQAAGVAI
ncbi:MAG: YczE/YyaS/YitT family protein [Lawsonibacter sp.]